jgi:uncharacterized protein YbjT (DUF2867 family)
MTEPARVVVAGATGKLGQRIMAALTRRGATAVPLTREQLATANSIADACREAGCVVSALAGLRDVIVDVQGRLLDGAQRAQVPRFIPSDFCTDYGPLVAGENRNFDLRREFHAVLDRAPIAATAIFNGAFAELLMYGVPLLDASKRTVGYWGEADHRIDFTTMDDVADYTAAAALDPTTPTALRIASFQVSPAELAQRSSFELVRLGSVDELRQQTATARAANPQGETELYPRWQQAQYTLSMVSTTQSPLDTTRYPDVTWTSIDTFLARITRR